MYFDYNTIGGADICLYLKSIRSEKTKLKTHGVRKRINQV